MCKFILVIFVVAYSAMQSATYTLVSDNYTQVVSKNVPNGGPAFQLPLNSTYSGWTSLAGSNWIWDTNNQDAISVTFTKTFYLYCQLTSISLIVSADDSFYTRFNNQDPGCNASGNYWTTLNCSITSYAVQGFNNLSLIVTNSYSYGGLLYRLDIQCQFDPTLNSGNCLCNTGYYWNGVECESCYGTCLNCIGSGKNECNSCNNPFSLQPDNTCTCNSHYYFTGSVCSVCDSSCLDCTGPLRSNCSSCNSFFSLQSDKTCKCNSHYYLNGSVCSICDSSCLDCTGPLSSNCVSCNSPFSLQSDKTCKCNSHYYFTGSVCSICDSSCLDCTGPLRSNCSSCNSFFSLQSDKTCKCNSHYYLNGSVCSVCDSSCLDCTGPLSSNCVSCENGYYLFESSCNKCYDGCNSCTTFYTCTSCLDLNASPGSTSCTCNSGYYNTSSLTTQNSCIKCYSECKTCDQPDICLECIDPNAYPDKNKGCKCNYQYYNTTYPLNIENSCNPCNSNCSYCNNSNTCISCIDPNSVPSLTSGCQCKSGFYYNSNKTCQPCKTNCIECQQNAYLENSNCYCEIGYQEVSDLCTPKYFTASLTIDSKNVLTFTFSENPTVTLTLENFEIFINTSFLNFVWIAVECLQNIFKVYFGYSSKYLYKH
jgi:hypothetical protein